MSTIAPPASAEGHVLRLYVAGSTPRSLLAVEAIRQVCEEHLRGNYRLEVFDIHQHPELARSERLVAAPTLVRERPLPTRRLVGDMSRRERVLDRLGLPQASGPR
jgi:circadian clock protein KaiB